MITLIRFDCFPLPFKEGLASDRCPRSPFASSVFAPAVAAADQDFKNTSSTLSTLGVTGYVFGYAVTILPEKDASHTI